MDPLRGLGGLDMWGARRLAAITVATTFVVAACGSKSPFPSSAIQATETARPVASVAAFRPHFESVPCPDDVTELIVLQVSCGYLTVLEDRVKADGRTIQLFVIRVEPPGGTTTPDPVILIGGLAATDDYGGVAPAAQRTHRVAYLMDARGVGHSKPSLDCPEIGAGGPKLAGLRLRDPARQTSLLDTVRACHDRLVGQGIALAAYDLESNAADLEDLRTTLGIPTWNLEAEGDASRIAFEIARRFPSGLRSIYTDSPALPMPDFITIAPAAFDLSISRLVAACAAQPACASGVPNLEATLQDAEARLDATPVTLEVTSAIAAIQAGHPIPVVVDGAALVRWVRASLAADGGHGASAVLRTVRAVLDGKLTADDPMVLSLASDAGDCLGLLPRCDERLSLGAMFSIICGDVVSQIDQSKLVAAIAGRPAYADVFVPSPLLSACDVWPVGRIVAGPEGPVTGGVPTLIIHGSFDPFSSSASDLSRAVNGSANVFLLESPNASYNAAGYYECLIRNAWIDALTAPPADTSCLAQIPAIPLAP